MAHNGGFVQIGAETNKAFNNMLLNSNWADDKIPLSTLNSDGYPTSIPAGKVWKLDMYQYNPDLRPGNYILKGDGSGTINVGFYGNINVSGTGWRYVIPSRTLIDFPVGNTSNPITITAVGGTPISNLQLCHADDETDMDAGNIWQSTWLSQLADAKVGCVRWLNATGVGGVNVDYSDITPSTYVSWAANHFRTTQIATACTWNSSTRTYAITLSGFSKVDGASVYVVWDQSAGDGAVYVDVEGTGQTLLKNFYGGSMTTASFTPSAGKISKLVYNSTLGAFLLEGGVTNGTIGTRPRRSGSLPLSAIVDLCNRLGAHLWYNIPMYWMDPFNTSAVTSLATYFRDNLDPGLSVTYEPCNEVWNTKLGFWPTQYSHNMEIARGYPANQLTNNEEWVGRANAKIGPVLETVYGVANKNIKYKLVSCFQTFNRYINNPRVTSARYVASEGGTPAKNYLTNVGFANYYTSYHHSGLALNNGTVAGVVQGNTNPKWIPMIYYADLYANGTTEQKATAVRWLTDGCFIGDNSTLSLIDMLANQTLRQPYYGTGSFNLPTIFYEGGYSNDATPGDPVLTVSGTNPDGTSASYGPNQVMTGYQTKINNLKMAGRFDKKMRWVGYWAIRKLIAIGYSSFPSRYQLSGGGDAIWPMYNPNWAVALGNSTAEKIAQYPTLQGIDEDGKAFQDYSNGRVVFYCKTL